MLHAGERQDRERHHDQDRGSQGRRSPTVKRRRRAQASSPIKSPMALSVASTSGTPIRGPTTRTEPAMSTGQTGEEDAEENSSGLIPRTPCSARFWPIARWM